MSIMPTATREDARARELARIPKATLARMHAANGGLMGEAAYLKWTHGELVSAVLDDERAWRAYGNREYVRLLLHERQPAWATALEIACAALT